MKFSDKYIDLHAHLDGSITVDIAKKIAKIQNIPLPNDDVLLNMLSLPPSCESLNDFLKCFEFPLTLLQTKESLTLAVKLVLEKMKNDGVIYAEIRFAPQLHTKKGLTQEEAVIAAIEGLKNSSIPSNLILCCMRGKGNETENNLTIELAHKYLTDENGVAAVDLAGAEALFPTENFAPLFKKASKYNIPITIHAGEADGFKSVEAALKMGAKRIGHGIRIADNEPIMEKIKDMGIFLEMCPTSNRQTKAVADMKNYPIIKFLNKGIKITINTDDLAIERTDIAKEFEYIEDKFNVTAEQEKIILKNSIDAAFTSERTKENLRKQIGL